MGILEQLGIDPKLIVVNILGFLLLLWILKKFLYKPVMQMLADRQEEIRSTYEAAEREKSAMEDIRRDYEKRMAAVESEAHERIQAAVKEAQGIRDDIVSEARSKAESVLQRGEDELAREREKTIVALRQEVAELVISASSNLLERSMDDDAHRKLIGDFISTVGKAE